MDNFKSSFRVDLMERGRNRNPSGAKDKGHRSKCTHSLSCLFVSLSIVGLVDMPVLLLGVLNWTDKAGSHGELVLNDTTSDIVCEVAACNVVRFRQS